MIFMLLAAGAGPAAMAAAQTMQDYEVLRSEISAVYSDLSASAADIEHPSEIAAVVAPFVQQYVAISANTANANAPAGQALVELVDLRLGLVQMALAVGGNDQLTVVRAQSSATPKIIMIQSGALSLEGLREWIAAQPNPDKLMDGDRLIAPLMVLQTGRLELNEGDRLELSTADGAFLANFGVLTIDGAQVSATGDINPNMPDFAPFVATVGSGQAQISNAKFEGLGFGTTAAFSGVSVINRGLYAPLGRSHLIDSVLRDVQATTFESGTAPLIQSNFFSGPASTGLVLRRTDQAQVLSNVFLGDGDGAAIQIMDGSLDSMVAGNLTFNTQGTGVFVTQASHGTEIMDNFIWQSAGGGISVSRSDCVNLVGNVTIDNRRKGIELRTSRNSTVRNNQIFGNQSAGLFIGDQPIETVTQLRGNVFVGNRFGLSSASADQLSLLGNDFSNQFPRFLEGDLASQSSKIVADLLGTGGIELKAGGIELFNAGPLHCQQWMEG